MTKLEIGDKAPAFGLKARVGLLRDTGFHNSLQAAHARKIIAKARGEAA